MKLKDIIGSMASKFAALLCAFSFVGASQAATITVGSSGADYTTLKAAFAAAQDGDAVQLIEDIEYSTTQGWSDKLVVNGKRVVFDLNGHNVTYTRSANPSGPMFYLQNGAELSIDGTGTIVLTPITTTHTVFPCVSMADNTGLKATLGKNVTVYAECFGSVEYNTKNAETGSTFDIYGTIIGNNSSYINNLFSCPSGVKNFTVNILGGTLAIPKYSDQHINIQASTETTFTLNMASGKIYCTQANFNAVKFNLYAAVKSTFNITGGYFGSNVPKAGTDPTLGFTLPDGYGFYPVSDVANCPYQVGVCEAKIGNVCYPSVSAAIEAAKASDFVTLNVDYSDVVTIPAEKTVNFNGGSYTFSGSFTVNGTLRIVGGTYTFNPAAALLGPGCSVTDNGDGTWTVIQSVAQVGETSYTTFADALTAANALGTATIKFLADVDLGSSTINIASGKSITLDLNGNNVSCSGNDGFSVKSGATLVLCDTSDGQSGALTHKGSWDLSDNSGTIEILSGTYNVVNYGVAYNNDSAVLNIKGGTINSAKRAYFKGVTTISGGTIKGTITDVKTTVITGGVFNNDPTAYVDAENYQVLTNTPSAGYWTVRASQPVATIDDKTYDTIEAVIEDIADSTPVEITADTTIGTETIEAGSTVTTTSGTASEATATPQGGGDPVTTTVTPKTVTIEKTGEETKTVAAYVVSQGSGESARQSVVTDVAKDETVVSTDANKTDVSDFVDVGKVLANAVADNDIDASTVTSMELSLSKTEKEGAEQGLSEALVAAIESATKAFEVHPVATITTTTTEGNTTTTDTATYEVQNAELAADASFTFTLDFGVGNAGKFVSLTHYAKDGTVKKHNGKDSWTETLDANGIVTVTLTEFSYLLGTVSEEPPATYVAQIGDTKYESLAEALADVTKDTPLTWVSEDDWPVATPVYYNGNFYAVEGTTQFGGGALDHAIAQANTDHASSTDVALIYVRPGYTQTAGDKGAGTFLATYNKHQPFASNIIIYGNNASLGGEAWEPSVTGMTRDMSVAIYNLHDGAGIWGQHNTPYVLTATMENCNNVHEYMVNGSAGSAESIANVTIKNCTFGTRNNVVVASTNPGTVVIDGCTFTENNNNYVVNINNKNGGTTTATISNSTFNGGGNASKGIVRVNGEVEGTTMSGTFENLTFNDTSSAVADIQIGHATEAIDNKANVSYTVSGTTGTLKVFEVNSTTLKNDGETAIAAANNYSGNNKPAVAQIGDDKYATLAAAILAAQNGDTIEILDGTWGADAVGTMTTSESLSVRAKSLTIQAADGATPKFTNTILSLGYDDSSTTRNAAITVRGLAFENTMLLIGNYPQVTVEGCSFVGSNGNSSSAGALAIIESCASNYNRDEFILDQVTVRNCTFDGTNSGHPALRLRDSGNVLITGNTIANSNHNGILLESDTTHSRVNTLVSKTVVIQNNTITEWNAGNVADGGRGIRAALGTMAAGSSVTISGNVFRKEQTGFDSPDFVKISDVGSGNTVDLSGNDWNNMLLSEVKGNSAIYSSDGTTTLASVVTTRKEPVAEAYDAEGGTLIGQFATVNEAIAAAGATYVKLLDNVTLTAPLTMTKSYTLDFNGKTIYYNTTNTTYIYRSSTITFKGGTLDISGAQLRANYKWNVFYFENGLSGSGGANGAYNNNVTFDGMTLYGDGWYAYSVFTLYAGGPNTLTFTNSTINLKNEANSAGGVFKVSASGNEGPINIINSAVTCTDVVRFSLYGTVNVKDSTVTFTGGENAFRQGAFTFDNSTVTVSGAKAGEGKGLVPRFSDTIVTNGSALTFIGSNIGKDVLFEEYANNIVIYDTSTVTAASVSGAAADRAIIAPANYVLVTTDNGGASVTYSVTPAVARIGDTYYATFADAIEAADAYAATHDGAYPTITVLNGATEQDNTRWKIVDGYLVRSYFYKDDSNANLWHIANLDGLIDFRKSVNNKTTYSGKTIQLDADIDMTGVAWLPIGGGTTEDADTSETWQNYYFAGTFDGQNHVISNLTVALTKEDSRISNRAGLFGFVEGGTVENIIFENADITAGYHSGVAVGYARGESTISGILVRGNIKVDAKANAGGIIGNSYSATVTNCSVRGVISISVESSDVGGITGYGYSNVENCTVEGQDQSVISGYLFTGGISGYPCEGAYKIKNCSVSGITVTSPFYGVGGIAGVMQYGNSIIDCTVSNVTVEGSTDYISDQVGLVAGACLGKDTNPCYIYGCTVSDSIATLADGTCTFDLNGDKNYNHKNEGNGYVYYNSDKTSTVNNNTVALTSGTYSASPETAVAGKTAVSVAYTAKSYVAEGYAVTDNGNGTWTIGTPTPVAMIGSNYYTTLADAIAAVPTDGTLTTITMIADVSDAVGISVASGKNFIVDFAGHTYTVNKPGAGSSGTETSAFQLLKDSTITFKNGTINIAAENLTPAVSPAKNIKRIIQNYANLTLDNMVVNAANQYGGEAYALSFNNGSSSLINGTKIVTTSDDTVAFDVYDYSSGGYASGSQLTIGEGVVINGKVVFDNSGNVAGNTALTVTGGTIGQVVAANGSATDGRQIQISGGTFDAAVPEEYCANGFIPKNNGDGTYGVKQGTYVAQIVETGKKYETLAEAIDAAASGDTVKLLADVDLGADGLVIESGKDFTLDIGEFNITGAVNGKLITNNGTLVVNGTTGCVYNTDVSAQGHDAILNNGTMTINGGWFGDSDNDKTNANPYNRGTALRNFGTAVINGGHFTDVDNNWPITAYAYAIISSGENAVLTVNNADVYGKCNGALALISGAATIVDGTFSVDGEYSHYAIYNPGCNATVLGGTFTKVESSASQNLIYASGNGTTTISGGTFASPKTDFISVSGDTASVSISGGIFSETPAGYCAVGYEVVANDDAATKDAYPCTVAHKDGYIVEDENGKGYAVIPVTEDWKKDNGLENASVAEIEAALNAPHAATKLKTWEAYVLNQTEPIKIKSVESVGNDDKLTTTLVDAKTGTGLDVTYSLVSVDGESETDGTASGDKSFALTKAEDGSLETGLYKVRVHFKPTGDTSASEVTVDSTNTVGVLKTQPTGRFVVVPVPFKELGGNDAPVKVASYIRSGLANGDVLHVYNGSNYDSWTYNGTSWDKTTNMTVNDENTTSTSESAEPSDAALSRGSAAILRRSGSTDTPLVFVGDYTGAAEEQTIAAGWNLVASPSLEPFDPATQFKSGKIQIPGDVLPKNYTFKNGKWGYSGVVEVDAPNGDGKIKMPGRIVVEKLPAGTGFWYFSDSQQQVKW